MFGSLGVRMAVLKRDPGFVQGKKGNRTIERLDINAGAVPKLVWKEGFFAPFGAATTDAYNRDIAHELYVAPRSYIWSAMLHHQAHPAENNPAPLKGSWGESSGGVKRSGEDLTGSANRPKETADYHQTHCLRAEAAGLTTTRKHCAIAAVLLVLGETV
ncbi:hypothetical protein B0H14DRAFT_2563278 [Mycena olivaceomarginata]|nr:hypothetical protein B0H14DRAFT_2563278 [Mycena olivaceomarginata]